MDRGKNKRAPFGKTLPRSVKKAAGRTDLEHTPLTIRTAGVDVTEEIERYVHARLGAKLGAVADRIERLTVRFDDVNGPRGGVDKKCRIKVVLAGLDSVVYESNPSSTSRTVSTCVRPWTVPRMAPSAPSGKRSIVPRRKGGARAEQTMGRRR